MERFFRIRPLAAFLAVSLMGNVCVQAEVSISGLQKAEFVTAIGRLSVIAANVADNKGLSAAKYLHVAADSMRLLNETFYVINKGFVVKEGFYYSAAWMVADLCNLAKDVQKCIKQAPVLSSDVQTQSDVVDTKFEKVGRYLATYILPTAEATLAAYLALSNGDSAKAKKARVVAKSFESLSRSLQFFLSTKRSTPEAKLGLAVVATNLVLLCGECFKKFPEPSNPVQQPAVPATQTTPAAPVVEQPAQPTQPVVTTAEQPVAHVEAPAQANVSVQQPEIPATQTASATQVVEQPAQAAQPVVTTVGQSVAHVEQTVVTASVVAPIVDQQPVQQDVRNIVPRTVDSHGTVLNVDEYFEKRANGHWYYKMALGRSKPGTKVGRMDLLVQLNAPK